MTVDNLTRARQLIELGRWDQALEALGPAIASDAHGAEAYCLQAQALIGLGRLRQAQEACERALSIDPGDEWAHRLMAIVHLTAGRNRKAQRHAEEAVRLAPHLVEALFVLAKVQLSRNKVAEAQLTAERALDTAPYSALAQEIAGQAAEGRKELDQAERHYREGLRLEPSNADLSLLLAELLRRTGRRDEAQEAVLAAGRSSPTDERVRRALGRIGAPVLGGVTLFLIKAGIFVSLRGAIEAVGDPLTLAAIAAAVIAIGAFASWAIHAYSTHDLPQHVRSGLVRDRRNGVLLWVQAAALLAVPLAIWSALIDPPRGGPAVATAFAAFAAFTWFAAARLWTGPKSTLARVLRLPG